QGGRNTNLPSEGAHPLASQRPPAPSHRTCSPTSPSLFPGLVPQLPSETQSQNLLCAQVPEPSAPALSLAHLCGFLPPEIHPAHSQGA
uniref:Uncharacterized protein n=1 Tax=Cyanistes caeruleus TaxID=156563 RepID=A0A8C0Z9E5_CYACU